MSNKARVILCFSMFALVCWIFGLSAFESWTSEKQQMQVFLENPQSQHQVDYEATKRIYEECLTSLSKEECAPLYNM